MERVTSFKLDGNAYILTVRDDMGDVKELYVLNPRNIRIERLGPGEPLIYFVKIKDMQGVYEQRLTNKELLHIPDFRLPGEFYGLSPIAACRTTLGAAMAADTLTYAFKFENGFKLYRPYDPIHKWFSNVDSQTVQGYIE